MKSQFRFAAALFFLASTANASSIFPSLSLRTPITQSQAEKLLDEVLEVGQVATRPTLEVVDESSYAIASVSGNIPRIVLSRNYLAKLDRPALRFALAHELAHLHLNHHSHIRRLRTLNGGKLAAAPGMPDANQTRPLRLEFHAIEFSADQLAMQWCVALGCTLRDAELALSGAYGFRTSETESHPALESRLQMLRFHHDIP